MNEMLYELWLFCLPDISRGKKRKLLDIYGTAEGIYNADINELKDILSEGLLRVYENTKDTDKIKKTAEGINENHIEFIYEGMPSYPERLKNIPDPPISFCVKGRLPSDDMPTVGIIGSRRASAYGVEVAMYFARELAKNGVGIISGLAMGIDGMSHKGALMGGGYTLGVIGGGIYSVYPRENYMLYKEMGERGGIFSEYPPKERAIAFHFPERNRIISAFSDCLLVVEAKEKSGTFITVDQALEQGKEIYVIPGRISDLNSRGCYKLMEDGAKPVNTPKELMEYMGMSITVPSEEKTIPLDPDEKKVYDCLSLRPVFIDEIVRQTKLSVGNCLSILLRFEIQGLAKQPVKNYYTKFL